MPGAPTASHGPSHVLSHEAVHLSGVHDEALTECYAVQTDAAVARSLGATDIQARSIAVFEYYANVLEPAGYRFSSPTAARVVGSTSIPGQPHGRARTTALRPSAILERPLDLPLSVPVGEIPALVPGFLPARNRQLDLHASVLEVEPRGYKREAALLHFAEERVDLAAVKQELAVSIGVVVGEISLRVLGDVHTDEIQLSPAHIRIRALKRHLSFPE